MATSGKIRVGIVGASASRGFASIAHMPALQALPQFEIVAVCTTRQETAEAAARHYGAPLAFSDPARLAQHPDVDLVTVSVKVPDHYPPVMAAIDAGKHVYCEWPLGRDTEEAMRLLDAAERRGIRHAVGLQGQVSPAINYVRDLVAEGYVGRVLTATLIGCAPNWGPTIDRAYQADRANGANLMTITGGHQIDALCYCLGEFRELSAFAVSQRDRIPLEATGELVAKNVPDQLVVSGIVGSGAVVSFQIRGGMTRGTEFLFEIHGDAGDLVLAARLDAAPGADCSRRAGGGKRARGTAGAGEIPLGPAGVAGRFPLQCRAALRPPRRKHPRGQAGEPRLCRCRHPPPLARCDRAGLGERTEADAVTPGPNGRATRPRSASH
jgi:predicted dehydrogenase